MTDVSEYAHNPYMGYADPTANSTYPTFGGSLAAADSTYSSTPPVFDAEYSYMSSSEEDTQPDSDENNRSSTASTPTTRSAARTHHGGRRPRNVEKVPVSGSVAPTTSRDAQRKKRRPVEKRPTSAPTTAKSAIVRQKTYTDKLKEYYQQLRTHKVQVWDSVGISLNKIKIDDYADMIERTREWESSRGEAEKWMITPRKSEDWPAVKAERDLQSLALNADGSSGSQNRRSRCSGDGPGHELIRSLPGDENYEKPTRLL